MSFAAVRPRLRPDREGRASWRRLVAVLFALALGLGAVQVALSAAPAQAADLASTPLITWNMQGGYTQENTKWTQVAAFVQYIPTPLLLLQEVGAGPPSEVPGQTQNLGVPAANNPANVQTVRHSQWRVGRYGITYDVYFLRQPNGAAGTGGRVNTAIVSPRAADAVRVIQNPVAGARNLLGILLGNTWYYTIHAQSGNNGGFDAAGLLQQVANVTPPGQHWVVGGDFNRDPGQLTIPPGSYLYRTNEATHQGGGELDYVVASQNVLNLPTRVIGGFLSDHFPVQVGVTAAAAEPTLDYSPPQALESMQAGGVLDVSGGATGNNSQVITYHRDRAANQAWVEDIYQTSPVDTVRFRGVGSNRCLDILNSTTATSGRPLVIFDCNNNASQQWYLEDLGDSETRIRSVLNPNLCMNVSGGQDVQDGPPMIVYNCSTVSSSDANERFFFTPADASGTPRILDPYGAADDAPGFRSLESMQAGGDLTVLNAATANNSPVITYHLNRGTNQGWYINERADHALQFEGVQSRRCLDIYNSSTATSGSPLVIFDCKSTTGNSQWWTAEDVGNHQVRFHSVLNPNLCMNVSGGQDIPDGPPMIAYNCSTGPVTSPNERFTFTPYDVYGVPFPDTDQV
jgi:hypothetical protein